MRNVRAAVAALVLAAAGITALSQQAAAGSSARLYVDRNAPACSDTGSGSRAVPYCTIQAAADVAMAGDTVVIGGSDDNYFFSGGYSPYDENVTVTHSGTRYAPITFEPAEQTYTIYGPTAGFTVKGDYVEIVGATVASQRSATIVVSGAHDTIDGVAAELNVESVAPTIEVQGNDTTIERSRITGYGANVIVLGAAAQDTTVTTNIVHLNGAAANSAISATGAHDLTVTSNTIEADCGNGISLTGSTHNADVHNNIVIQACQGNLSTSADLVVGSGTAATTSVSYNILTTANGVAPAYSWAGTTYTTAAGFQKATGQGKADLVEGSFDFSTNAISSDNPAIDSANSNAPGELSTDIYRNTRVDDPAVPNTGAGRHSSYDRGAIEYQEYTSFELADYFNTPQRIALIFNIKGIAWGPDARATVDWGDGSDHSGYWSLGGYAQFYSGYFEVPHAYAQRGTYTVTATVTDSTQTVTRTIIVATTGSTYQPVTPTRVLDTRKGIGAPEAKVGPMSGITVDVAGSVPGSPPRQTITAAVVNVTVTDENAPGYLTAYPYGRVRPLASNVNFSAWTATPNLVTVKAVGGKIDLFNGSAGGVDLIADVQGYYVDTGSGDGYIPLSPARILDTRKGLGGAVVQPGGTLTLAVEGSGGVASSGVTAVALNLTATGATPSGYLTVYPDGATPPYTSNLNYSGGPIVQNLVVAKTGTDGKIAFRNNSTGPVQLIADVTGYYTAANGHAFIPIDPVRVLDTRNGTGQLTGYGIPIAPMSNARWGIAYLLPQLESALVATVTVTQPQAGGYITAYPGGSTRPATSNINFSANQTIANLVMGKVGQGTVNLFNDSAGSTQLVADLFGYFS